MFERFTDGARRCIVLAQEEAQGLAHPMISTGHLLLGVIGLSDPALSPVLGHAQITAGAAREQVRSLLGPGQADAEWGHIPFTPHAKKALETSLRVALRLDHAEITPSHLLLGLIAVPGSTAVTALVAMGVDVEQLGAAVTATAPHGAGVGRRQPMPPRDVEQIQRLVTERRRYRDALRRYGRHDDDCDPERGCTCGLGPLLA
jgi:ATP-dependent Clp protease ATP-binding subunit ClpA